MPASWVAASEARAQAPQAPSANLTCPPRRRPASQSQLLSGEPRAGASAATAVPRLHVPGWRARYRPQDCRTRRAVWRVVELAVAVLQTPPRPPPDSTGDLSNARGAQLPVVWRPAQEKAEALGVPSRQPPAGKADPWTGREVRRSPNLEPEVPAGPSGGEADPPAVGRWSVAAPPPVGWVRASLRSACRRTSPGVRPSAVAVLRLALRALTIWAPKAGRMEASPARFRLWAQ